MSLVSYNDDYPGEDVPRNLDEAAWDDDLRNLEIVDASDFGPDEPTRNLDTLGYWSDELAPRNLHELDDLEDGAAHRNTDGLDDWPGGAGPRNLAPIVDWDDSALGRNLDGFDDPRDGYAPRNLDGFDDPRDGYAPRNLDGFDDAGDGEVPRNLDGFDDAGDGEVPRNLDGFDDGGLFSDMPRNRPEPDDVLHVVAATYDELWSAQLSALAQRRGAVRHVPADGRGGVLTIPLTTNTDVLQLATYWTQALTRIELMQRQGRLINASGLAGEQRRWFLALDEVGDLAVGARPDAVYPQNAAFWRAAASLSITLATLDELPDPPPFTMDLIERRGRRNGPEPDGNLHLTAKTYDEMFNVQKSTYGKQRGTDLRQTPPAGISGGPMQIPRTTNADVMQVAAYWSRALADLDEKRRVGGLPSVQGLDGQIQRWTAILADVERHAKPGKPGDLYPNNEEFWRAAGTLSITIAAIDEQPPSADLVIDSLRTGVVSLPDTLKTAASAVASAAGAVAHAVGDVAHEAGAGLFRGLGKPLLIGGGVIAALFLLTRRGGKPAEAV